MRNETDWKLEAGGTGMLLDSKILARLAGADERLFHRTLSLRRQPATTRTSTTTTPIWVRSLHSALSHPFSPSSLWSLLSIQSSSTPRPLSCSFFCYYLHMDGDVPLKLSAFPPCQKHSTLSRHFLYIFFIASSNSGTEIDFDTLHERGDSVFHDEFKNLARVTQEQLCKTLLPVVFRLARERQTIILKLS